MIGLLALVVPLAPWAAAGQAPTSSAAVPLSSAQEPGQGDPERSTGRLLRPMKDGWALRLQLPVAMGLTEFELGRGLSLDNLATIALIPTAEFIVPLDERWTLMPFAGLGGALQLGDRDLIGDNRGLGLLVGGVRAQRWEPFAERYTSVFKTELRYTATSSRRNGVLGDWTSLDAAVELRRAFGEPREGPRFESGPYAKQTWFLDPIELEIAGVTPTFVGNQTELGLSFGSTSPYSLLGFVLPRAFLGVSFGEELSTLRLTFGRL